jgi:hypothetical protein
MFIAVTVIVASYSISTRVSVNLGRQRKMLTKEQIDQSLYDEKQTELCDKLAEFLRSISFQATKARQNYLGSDKCLDYLQDIEDDLNKARKLCEDIIEDNIICEKCGVHLMKHDTSICGSRDGDKEEKKKGDKEK